MQSAGEVQCCIGQVCEYPAGGARIRVAACGVVRPRGAAVVGQRRSRRAQVVLERDEPGLIDVRAPQVQFHEPLRSRLLNHTPEQERHPAEAVVRCIRPAVLVNNRLLERQRQDARDWLAVLAGRRGSSARSPRHETRFRNQASGCGGNPCRRRVIRSSR